LLACRPTPPAPTPIDLSSPLQPGEVRAGVIDAPEQLIGGIAAEGRLGDLLIENERVRFVIQGVREGSSYIGAGGHVLDADIVRPAGEAGHDVLEDGFTMPGFGRILAPRTVEVIDDGRDGLARIRTTGEDVPLPYFVGALESETLLRAQGLTVVTDFVLRPDTLLLEVTTTITASIPANNVTLGDGLIGARERAQPYTSGLGLLTDSGDKDVAAFIGLHNDVAVALLGPADTTLAGSAAAGLLPDSLQLQFGFDETVDLAAGESHTWTRWWGVGRDLAALTDARLVGTPIETVEGVLSTAAGPVAGARVHVVGPGGPMTVAFTDAEGRYRADVPAGTATTLLADGRGTGRFTDLDDQHVPYAPFSHPDLQAASLASIDAAASGPPYARGLGAGTVDGLVDPGTVRVTVADGQPFTVRIGTPVDEPDDLLLGPLPDDLAAAGWSRGGPLELAVPPGTHPIVVHRGPRFEAHTATIEVVAGETVPVDATLAPAFAHDGYLWADPHAHATPSHDGLITMEDRLLVHAAAGVQLHVGSDHDRVADYRPLVAALGLDGVLQSIVADEVSPLQRGHLNAYPLEPDVTARNHGAVDWWSTIPDSTQQLIDRVRDRHGDIIVQANHPLDSGIGDAAGWQPGRVQRADYWVDDLDAMEVLNEGATTGYFDVWMDLVTRGHRTVPVGVSDAHAHFQGPAGVNGTWVGLDAAVGSVTDDALVAAFRAGDVHVGRGVFLALSERPGQTFTDAATLEVTARTASYATVDRLHLYRDGVIETTVEGASATFTLAPDADAVYVVVAEGDQPMLPLTELTPWATTNAYRVDVGGDGWTAPLPPLTLE
jgi:hypothetical protein